MHKLRWKHIYRINSSKRIMWLCAMRRDNLTNQRTDLVHSIHMLLWSFWKAWVKSVVKVFLYNCYTTAFPNSRHTPPKWPHLLCLVCSLWGASKLSYMKMIIFSGFLNIVRFSAMVHQDVTILFSLTCWMETVLYSHMFYAILQFCT